MLARLLFLSCAVLVYSAAVAAINSAEREVLISDAIEEAKTQSHARAAAENRAGESTRAHRTSQDLLFKFKKSSAKAVAQGRAGLLFENTIRRAEEKLLEAERQAMHGSDARARAEELAKEVLHRTGSLLTKQEIAKIYSASGCRSLTEPPDCSSPATQTARTADGTCNNIQNPTFGAAVTALRRILPPRYEDGVCQLRGTMQSQNTGLFEGAFSPPYPSARLISLEIVEDREVVNENLSHFLFLWGQIVDHDVGISPAFAVDCSGCTASDVCIPIQIAQNDPTFGITGTSPICHPFMRSIPACPPETPDTMPPRQQINDITSFIDGSQVYGSSSALMESLRDPNSGKLLTGPSIPASGKPSLPVDSAGNFRSGDVRTNEHTALIVLHTILLREHNRIADALAAMNPMWDSDEIFETTRQIVGAEIQKITYKDYLPLILGPAFLNQQIGDYDGYNNAINPGMPSSFTAAAFRFGHSQIRREFDRLNESFLPTDNGPLNLVDSFFDPSQFASSGGTDPILRGLISVPVRRMDEFVNDILTNHLFQTDTFVGLDLVSLNIQRGRDHGLPPYMIWKRWAQRACNVSSDFQHELTAVRLMSIYGSMDTVDLWVGALAEARLPGSLVGATLACIFANTFGAVRDGDRFYYENSDATALFSADQRAAIESASLSRLICDNADNIPEIQPNAFRLDQIRVSCSSSLIPEIDLTRWNDPTSPTTPDPTTPSPTTPDPTTPSPTTPDPTTPSPCTNSNSAFLRINCNGESSRVRRFRSFSRRFPTSDPLLVDEESKSGTQGSVCLAIRCPEMGGSIQLVVSGPIGCSVTPNLQLPLDSAPTFSNTYSAILGQTAFSEANGIYADAESCTAGSVDALDYACSRIELHTDIQNELLGLEEAIAQKNGKENKQAQVSLSDPQVPESVRELFENGGHQSVKSNKNKLIAMLEGYLRDLKKEAKRAKSTSTSLVENHQDEKSDAQLISELEQALRHN